MLAPPCRHDDDPDRGALPQLLAELEPVAVGQVEVEEDEVGVFGLERPHRLGGVGTRDDVVAPHGEVGPDEVDDVAVVLDDEDPCPRVSHRL